MKLLSTLALVLGLSMTLVSVDAEAKRLGSNKSLGMQRQSQTHNTATPAQQPGAPAQTATTAAAASPAAAAAAAPKRSWLGPVAGIAAGLGLAALASHLGFGEELASLLMMGLLAAAVVMVIGFIMRKRMANRAPMTPAPAGMPYAMAGGTPSPADTTPVARPHTAAAYTGGSMIGAGVASNGPAPSIPADFDVQAFAHQAKVQFIRLQTANDSGNLNDLRQFTSPEMFAELQLDIAERQGQAQCTEVLHLDAEVLEVVQEPQRYVASVRYSGRLREQAGAEPQAFSEIWHLEKPRDGSSGWVLAGIQQTH